jgi:hypothetical protein
MPTSPKLDARAQTDILARHAAHRGENIKLLVDTIASALFASGTTLDNFDKVTMASAAIGVLYPTQLVDVPSWGGE